MRAAERVRDRAARGAVAGVGGALALAPTDVAMRRLLGRRPAFDLSCVTRRLVRRVSGRRPGRSLVGRAEWGLRLGYGAGLGALLSAVGLRAATGACVLAGFELLAMPAAGATPPVRTWSWLERWLLLGHAAVSVVVSQALLRLGRAPSAHQEQVV